MSEKVPKHDYVIDEEEYDEEIDDEEKGSGKLTQEEINERIKKHEEMKAERTEAQLRKKDALDAHLLDLKEKIVKILDKGKVTSKLSLTNLLIKAGIENYYFKINLISNRIKAEIPSIGRALKELRFDKEVNFSMVDGSHVYYTKDWKKTVKVKEVKYELNWRKYIIPEGNNEVYVVLKVPGSDINSQHMLSSCYPRANFGGFKIDVDRKHAKTHGFRIFNEKLTGYFDEDKLILKCKTSTKDIDKTLYTIIQIGRRIIEELIKLNRRFSEIMIINNLNNTLFIPVIPIFRAVEKGSFYESKYDNALRIIFDFPEKFDKKLIYGKYSILSKERKEGEFDLKKFYGFIDKNFIFQTKSFIINAILNDWIINPAKALNYMTEDEELKKLIDEYTQDIETDRIIQERLEESMEKSELLKDMTTNLLLTLLGLSLIANTPWFQWGVIVFFIAINVLYIFLRTRRTKKKIF